MTAIKILSREPQKSNILVSAMQIIPELDDGKIYRKTLPLQIKFIVSCRFSQHQSSHIKIHIIQEKTHS
jgi:hypothetical protein